MYRLASEFAEPKAVIVPMNNLKAVPAENGGGKIVKMVNFGIWRNVAAAAIILFVVSAALNIYYYNNYTQTTDKYKALLAERNTLQASNNGYHQALNIIHDSVMHIVRMPGTPGKQDNMATLYWDTKTKDVYVYASNLQQTPQGKQYQLWALVDGKPVDAGVIGDCNGVCKMKNIPRAQAFAITLENEGGSKTPTITAMYVYGKV
jgi:anti-sigma-K factor RskA